MSWTLCTSGAAIDKAGANRPTVSGAMLALFSDQAEGKICAELHTDVVTNIASYGGQISGALSDICSSLIANKIINYDMSGYTSMREAETMLDVNDDIANKGLQVLKDKKFQRLST